MYYIPFAVRWAAGERFTNRLPNILPGKPYITPPPSFSSPFQPGWSGQKFLLLLRPRQRWSHLSRWRALWRKRTREEAMGYRIRRSSCSSSASVAFFFYSRLFSGRGLNLAGRVKKGDRARTNPNPVRLGNLLIRPHPTQPDVTRPDQIRPDPTQPDVTLPLRFKKVPDPTRGRMGRVMTRDGHRIGFSGKSKTGQEALFSKTSY